MAFKQGIEVNKQFILDRISEEDIFEKYFTKVVYDQSIINYNRTDKEAGCKFYVNKTTGRIRFKDFSQGYNWDCLDVAKLKIGGSFQETLIRIAQDFELIKGRGSSEVCVPINLSIPKGIESRKKLANKVISKEIRLVNRRLTYSWKDQKYFGQFAITPNILTKFYVYTFDKAFIYTTYQDGSYSKVPVLFGKNEMRFAYYLGRGEWKLYFPERTKSQTRFIQINGDSLQGYFLLPDRGERLVFTKAYKDVMCLYALDKIPSVAAQSEGQVISKKIVDHLAGRFERLYILYDNDMAGMRGASKNLLAHPNLTPIMFPRINPKDVSDNIKKFGIEKVWNLLEPVII